MSVKSLKTGSRSISLLAGNTPEHHVLIAESTVGAGGTASVTFSNIPADYQHLQIRGIAQAGTSYGRIRFNGDTGANYRDHYLVGNGVSTFSGSQGTGYNSILFMAWGGFGVSPSWAGFVIDVLDYTSASKNKTTRLLAGFDNNGSGVIELDSGIWFATPSAITSVNISTNGNFAQYSTFQLYGVR